jgi:multiple sugar transport system permease protein
VAVSLGTALMLNSKLARFKSLYRTIYFLPVVSSLIAVAIIWKYLYHPAHGLLNYFLGNRSASRRSTGSAIRRWRCRPSSSWRSGRTSDTICSSSSPDCRISPRTSTKRRTWTAPSWWQQFREITLPMLKPTTVFVVMITVIGYFQFFAEPYVMTQGGPLNSTTSIVLLMYEQGFRWWSMGYAAAIAFVLFIIILFFTLMQMLLQRRMKR